MIEKQYRKKKLLSEVEYDTDMDNDFQISEIEATAVDDNFAEVEAFDSYLIMFGNVIDPALICSILGEKDFENSFQERLGVTYLYKGDYVSEDDQERRF